MKKIYRVEGTGGGGKIKQPDWLEEREERFPTFKNKRTQKVD